MNYADINRNMTLPERQRSLFNIISAAQMAAKESDAKIMVIYAPIYTDEYGESLHVYCPQPVVDILYKKRANIEWNIDAIVEPAGGVYFTRVEDLAVVIENTHANQRRISIEVEDK